MRLRELFAKGLAATPHPVTIPAGDRPTIMSLEPALIGAMGRCLEALLYPDESDLTGLHEVAASEQGFICGLIFSIGDHDLRIRRGLRGDSIELQMSDPRRGGFFTRAQGVSAVAEALSTRLGRAPLERFRWINLGGSPPTEPEAPPEIDDLDLGDDPLGDWLQPTSLAANVQSQEESQPNDSAPLLPNPLDLVPSEPIAPRSPEEISRLRAEYRRAMAVEELEDRSNDLRRRLADLTPNRSALAADPVLAALRDEIDGAPRVDISDEEVALLRDPQRRTQEFERRRAAIDRGLEEAGDRVREGSSLLKNPAFLPGTVLALICTVVSIVGGPALRVVALGNVACLAGTLAGVLQFLSAREALRGHRQRVLACEEARADLEDERNDYGRELAAVRRRHGVQTVDELETRREQRRDLEERAHEAQKAKRVAHAEQLATGADEREPLERQLEQLEDERAELGDCPLASFQIAQELRNLGLSPDGSELPSDLAAPVGAISSVGSWTTDDSPPLPLYELAAQLRLVGPDGLEGGGRRLWGRMLAALLNRRVAQPNLDPEGRIVLSDGSGLVWETLAQRERALVVESACLTLLMRGLGQQKNRPWPWMVRLDPFAGHTAAEVDRLQSLYERLAVHLQIIVLDSGRRDGSPR